MHSTESIVDTPKPLSLNLLGRIMLWLGFLVAAFTSVLKLEQDDKWQTIPWSIYLPAIAVGFAGIVLSKCKSDSEQSWAENSQSQFKNASASLLQLANLIADAKELPDRTPQQTLHWIDSHCNEPLAEFANSRQSIVDPFDMKTYADVMTEFASAERYINRSWSAAADGYIDEINRCIEIAHQHLEEAKRLLQSAEESLA